MADAEWSGYVPPLHARRLKVFLCHAREDKTAVEDLYHRLRNQGVDPWLDKHDLLPGEDWEKAIRRAVEETDLVLVCLSPRSLNKMGFVQKEIVFALDVAEKQPEGTIFIVPAKLESCDIPDRLKKWQAIDISSEEGYEQLLRAIWKRASRLELGVLFDTWRPTPVALDDFTPSLLRELARVTEHVATILIRIDRAGPPNASTQDLAASLRTAVTKYVSENDISSDVDITCLNDAGIYVLHTSYPQALGKSHHSIWSHSQGAGFSEWLLNRVIEMERGVLSWTDIFSNDSALASQLSRKEKRLKRKTALSFRRVSLRDGAHWTLAVEGHELASSKR
jgi:hypothetical protein